MSCECHKIDWLSPLKNGGIGEYRYLPEFGGGIHTQCVGPVAMPCQDKVMTTIVRVRCQPFRVHWCASELLMVKILVISSQGPWHR